MAIISVLTGKRCLITGASRGIGLALATRLLREGCHVFATARSPAPLSAVTRTLSASAPKGVTVASCAGDLTREDDIAAIVRSATDALGGVDILVNNAGVFPISPLPATSLETFDRCFAVNVRAPFLLMKLLLPAMLERAWGRILNIGSSSAYGGFPGTSVYCASKHALLGLSRSAFAECKQRGVRVYCLSPGSMKTDMGKTVEGQDFETFIEPEELAEYAAFIMRFDGTMMSEELRLNRLSVQ